MLVHAWSKKERIDGPVVEIDCPACARHCSADSYEIVEKMALYFIPLPAQRETFVQCGCCGVELACSLQLGQLQGASSYEISKQIGYRVSSVTSLAAVFGVLFSWVPLFGLIMALTAFGLSRRAGGWQKGLAMVGIPLSLVLTVLMFLWIGSGKKDDLSP